MILFRLDHLIRSVENFEWKRNAMFTLFFIQLLPRVDSNFLVVDTSFLTHSYSCLKIFLKFEIARIFLARI